MMQSKRNDVEAESEEMNELKSSNNQFDDDRQGKLNNWEVKTQIKYFLFFQENCLTTGWLEQSQLLHIRTRFVFFCL